MYPKIKRKATIELSVGTIVIIVLAMTMLILGFVLVKNIFSGATSSVKQLDDNIRKEITRLFTQEDKDIIVWLGSEHTAKIKQGTDFFGVAMGARTPDGSEASRDRLQYKLTFDEQSTNSCIKVLGKKQTEALFKTRLNQFNSFDEYEGSDLYALIELTIPKGTAICSQKVLIDVIDKENNRLVGGSFFKIDIMKSGLF